MNETTSSKPLAAFHARMNPEHADQLFVEIVKHLCTGKRYRDPEYTAQQLAKDLNTNTRYISTAVAVHTGNNYNMLVNGLRLRDAKRLLKSPKYKHYTAEEVGLSVGFSSRQSFYNAFQRFFNTTPRAYRLEEQLKKSKDEELD